MPSPAVRVVVSLIVAIHLLAVFVGPWAMPPQTSELAASVATLLKPYVQLLGLANGYRFFAPEPGPSHLVRYEITRNDGTRVEGVFPDRAQHTPRLLYHRYFMLSEFINSLSNPDGPSERADVFAKAYAEHLAETHDARDVKLYLRKHFVPRMDEVRAGRRLDDPILYIERPLWSLSKEGAAP